MDFISILIDWAPYLLTGIFVTLGLTAAGLGIGVLMGLPMAIGQVYSTGIWWLDKVMKGFIAVFVWFFRGLPILVLLFLFYFGIFPALGMGDLAPFLVGAVVLGLRGAAYQSQIFRGAIQSINEGQMTAARSLGMTKLSAIRNIILPQSFRIALPGWSNEYPNILTDSAVCYAIGVAELLTRSSQIVSQTYEASIYFVCAGIFIILNYAGMRGLLALENKIAVPGFSGSGDDNQVFL